MSDLEKVVELVPADGWSVQSEHGTQLTSSGVDLARLADVHGWLMRTGKPAKDAVHELFCPILEPLVDYDPGQIDSGSEAPISLGWVWCLNSQTYPEAIFHKGQIGKRENARLLKKTLPELGHVRFVDGTPGGLVYACAEAALRVWIGGDVSADPIESFKRATGRKSDEKYGVTWPEDFKLQTLLARLAVPHLVAHELWGWGTKAAPKGTSNVVPLQLVSTAKTTSDESPASANDVSSFSSLVAWRKSNPKTTWTQGHKKILKAESCSRIGSGKSGASKALASDLGLTPQRINELIRSANSQTKSEKKRCA